MLCLLLFDDIITEHETFEIILLIMLMYQILDGHDQCFSEKKLQLQHADIGEIENDSDVKHDDLSESECLHSST